MVVACATILATINHLIVHHIQLFRATLELFEYAIDHVIIVVLFEKSGQCCDFCWKQLVCLCVLLSVTKWNREEDLFDLFLVARQYHRAME